jgi:hypothetical protein
MSANLTWYCNAGQDFWEGLIQASSAAEAGHMAVEREKKSLAQSSAGQWCLAHMPERVASVYVSEWHPDNWASQLEHVRD